MSEEAKGTPSKKEYGDVEKIPLRKLLTYVDQLHKAERAGFHHDIRFGDRELYSWAGRKGLPQPGEKHTLFQQPLHTPEYAEFEGEIPSGYGKGTVKTHDRGAAFVTEATPNKIKFVLAHRKNPEYYTMIKLEGERRPWLIINHTPTSPEKKASDAIFTPDFSPSQLREMGAYREVYGPKGTPRLASLSKWPEHWYNEADPWGWLQWYDRYSKGRRIDDDTRQIKRWLAFKARHGGQMFQNNPTPRRAYALRNWAIDPLKLVKDETKRKELEKSMENYRNKKYKTAGDRPGLWENIRAKRARGAQPAKPGEKGYPDKKQWKQLTSKKAELLELIEKLAASPAWQRSEGKNPEGGLNAKGRASYNRATGGNLKAPVTESKPSGDRANRRKSFCARMCGHKRKNTGAATKSDPESRVNKALRKWRCKCGEELLKKAVLNILNREIEKKGGVPFGLAQPKSKAFTKPTQIKPKHDMTGNPNNFMGEVYKGTKQTMGNMLQHMRNSDPKGKLGLGNREFWRMLGQAPKMYSSLLGGDMKRLAGQMNSFGAGYNMKNFQ